VQNHDDYGEEDCIDDYYDDDADDNQAMDKTIESKFLDGNLEQFNKFLEFITDGGRGTVSSGSSKMKKTHKHKKTTIKNVSASLL
jgi:hypothetical protein